MVMLSASGSCWRPERRHPVACAGLARSFLSQAQGLLGFQQCGVQCGASLSPQTHLRDGGVGVSVFGSSVLHAVDKNRTKVLALLSLRLRGVTVRKCGKQLLGSVPVISLHKVYLKPGVP